VSQATSERFNSDTTNGLTPANRPVPANQLAIAACAAGIGGILLRLPFRTHLPPTWDSVQYVLGILHYDVTLHQPHPPGYYLYVHTAKLLTNLGLRPYTALVTLSFLAGGLTVALLIWWAGRLWGKYGALGAAVFTLFSPLAWVYSTHGDTYAVSGFFTTVVGYLCWRLLTTEREPIWPSAFALGLAGGFRPTDAMFLLPLWLWSVRRKQGTQVVTGLVLFGLITAAWLWPMIASTGGWDRYFSVSRQLSKMVWQFSPLLGNVRALRLFGKSLLACGSALLLAAWPLVLYAKRQYFARRANEPRAWTFLALWVGPALVFYLIVHFAQAGYLMVLIAPVVLLATIGLLRISERLTKTQLWGLLGVIVVLNAAFTWSVLVANDRQHEADMLQIKARLTQFGGADTVALTGISIFGQPHSEQLLVDFRWAMYLAPHIPIYIFPLELAQRCGGPPNHGYQLSSARVGAPLALHGVRNLLLLDPDLRQFLPAGAVSQHILVSTLAHIYLVRLPPNTTLTLGPEANLRFTDD